MGGTGPPGAPHHLTAPAPNGEGGARAMAQALADGDMKPEDVDYSNAHGTSTHRKDAGEPAAVKTVVGARA